MTPEDLTKMTTVSADYPWQRKGTVYLPVAARDVTLELLCDLSTNAVTAGMALALNDLLAVGPERWSDITELLLADANDACINVDLGFPTVTGEDLPLTNRREIGLNPDGSAPSGWASPDWIDRIQVMTDEHEGDDAAIGFKVEWELEHGCHIHLEQGNFTTFHP